MRASLSAIGVWIGAVAAAAAATYLQGMASRRVSLAPPASRGARTPAAVLATLVGDGQPVPCIDGHERPYLNLDSAASTESLPAVADGVTEFLPWYLSSSLTSGRHAASAARSA